MNKRILTLALASSMVLMTGFSTLLTQAAESQKLATVSKHTNKAHHAKASLLIKAPPEQVWDMILNVEDSEDTAYSKTLERKGNVSIIEEKYIKLPIIGEAVAVIKQMEEPFKRIDFELIRSDKFKAMEGSWILTPMENGKHTMVELTSYTDTGIPVPRFIVDITTKQRVKGRLQELQMAVEKAKRRTAVSATPSSSK